MKFVATILLLVVIFSFPAVGSGNKMSALFWVCLLAFVIIYFSHFSPKQQTAVRRNMVTEEDFEAARNSRLRARAIGKVQFGSNDSSPSSGNGRPSTEDRFKSMPTVHRLAIDGLASDFKNGDIVRFLKKHSSVYATAARPAFKSTSPSIVKHLDDALQDPTSGLATWVSYMDKIQVGNEALQAVTSGLTTWVSYLDKIQVSNSEKEALIAVTTLKLWLSESVKLAGIAEVNTIRSLQAVEGCIDNYPVEWVLFFLMSTERLQSDRTEPSEVDMWVAEYFLLGDGDLVQAADLLFDVIKFDATYQRQIFENNRD